MNPEIPIDPRQALEASLTALALGELPEDQAAFLRQTIAQDPELARMYTRLQKSIELVREIENVPARQPVAQPPQPKLSEQRRQVLMQYFKTVAPEGFAEKPPRSTSWLLPVAAAVLLMAFVAAALLPALARSKSKAQSFSFAQRSGSKQAWNEGLQNEKRLAAEPADLSKLNESHAQRPKQIALNAAPGSETVTALPGQVGQVAANVRGGTVILPAAGEKPVLNGIVLPAGTEFAQAAGNVPADSRSWSGGTTLRGFYDDEAKPGLQSAGGGLAVDSAGRRELGRTTTLTDESGASSLDLKQADGRDQTLTLGLPAVESPSSSLDSLGESERHVVSAVDPSTGLPAQTPFGALPATTPVESVVIDPTTGQPATGPALAVDPVTGLPSVQTVQAVKEAELVYKPLRGGVGGGGGGGGIGGIAPQTPALTANERQPSPPGAALASNEGTTTALRRRYILQGDAEQSLKQQLGSGAVIAQTPINSPAPSAAAPARKSRAVAEENGRRISGLLAGGPAVAQPLSADFPTLTGSVGTPDGLAVNDEAKPVTAAQEKSPILGDLPGVGRLFRSEEAGNEILRDKSVASGIDMPAKGREGDRASLGKVVSTGDSYLYFSKDGSAKGEKSVPAESKPATTGGTRLGWELADSKKDKNGAVFLPDTDDSRHAGLLVTNASLGGFSPDGKPVVQGAGQNNRGDLPAVRTPAPHPRDKESKGRPLVEEGKQLADTGRLGETDLKLNKAPVEDQLAKNRQEIAQRQKAQQEIDQLRLQSEAAERQPSTPRFSTNAPIPQPEVETRDNAFSTFSLNVSDVSFKLAAASLEKGTMPDPAGIRSEEFINAFDYRDPEPPPGVPVAFAWERARYPFAQGRDVLRFALKTAAQGRQAGRPLNLVVLLDNSGSMERADRVSIRREALRVLATQLQPQDRLSIILFSRTAQLWVDGATGSQAAQAAEQVSQLTPQGGTNLEEAMNLAYQTALRHYQANGLNRVVLLTDGAANLGSVDPEALKKKVEDNRKQGIALDCFGIGWEGYNDDLLEVLSRNGDGRYGFINTPEEAATEFVGQLAGALRVAASDVKVQVEFNPARVTAYRQIGYAKHQLTKEQFRDNTVDAAEIGAAESGNALYVVDINPQGEGPLAVVRVRYKVPGTAEFHEHEWAVPYAGSALALEQAAPTIRLATAASGFAEWLAGSPYAAEVTPDSLLSYLSGIPETFGVDQRPKRLEWMIRQAKSLQAK